MPNPHDPTLPPGSSKDTPKEKKPSLRLVHRVSQLERAHEARFYGQELGFCGREFVLCGLPYRKPKSLKYERRNGAFVLKVVGDPDFGVPYGQDRLIPIWLATAFQILGCPRDNRIRFRSASDIVRAFRTTEAKTRKISGIEIRRLREHLARVFGATYFVSDERRSPRYTPRESYRLIRRVSLWFEQDNLYPLEGAWQNVIELTAEFAGDLRQGSVPVDLESIRSLKESPAALDLYIWQAWRSYRLYKMLQKEQRIPVFGPDGLLCQLGTETKEGWKSRQQLRGWQTSVRMVWPECPNELSKDGDTFLVRPAVAIRPRGRLSLPGVSLEPPVPLREDFFGPPDLELSFDPLELPGDPPKPPEGDKPED